MATTNALSQLQLTQPVDTQNDRYMQLCDFLRRITEIIIHYKDHLPDDSRHLLSTTFSKAKRTGQAPPRAAEVRNLVARMRPVDVEPQGAVLELIHKCKESPSTFWNDNLPEKLSLGSGNILRPLFWQIREDEKLSVIYKAFYTTAIYLVVRDIREKFEVKTLTTKVKRHCSKLIMDQQDDPEERKKVEKTLSDDYTAGLAWERYAASLGGYGAFFLMGLISPWKYEVTLNKSDDLQFVVSHFKSIKVPETAERYGLHDLGYLILSEVLTRINTCIPPTVSTRKRKRPKKKPTATSASVPHQPEDVLSSDNSRIHFKRRRLNRGSESHRQTSTPITESRHRGRSVGEGNERIQNVEASTLADSSLEVLGYQSASQFHESGLHASNSQNMSSWHPGGGALDNGPGSSESLLNRSGQLDTTQEVIEQRPETPAELSGRQHIRTHQDRGSNSNELSMEPLLNPLPSLQGDSIANTIEWGDYDYFLPALFPEYLPNPLPPSTTLSAPAGWDLHRPGMMSQHSDSEHLPNPLPPYTATSAPVGWDWQQSSMAERPSDSEYLPNPLPPSTTLSVPGGWDLHRPGMMSQHSDSEHLPNPLPPYTATSAPVGWDWQQSSTISQSRFYECLANPLPPFCAASAPDGWNPHQSSTISRPTNCEYLPVSLPPSTAAPALAEWDSHESVSSDITGRSTRSPSIRLPNLLSGPKIDRLAWNGIPYSSRRTPAPLAIF